jgi:thioredoxin 1
MMGVAALTKSTFAQEVESDGLVLVDFWAPWCGPCKMIAPVLETLSQDMAGKVRVRKLNVDDESDIAGQFGVMSIPTLILFKNGKPVDKVVGFQSIDALKQLINKHA